jgi:hypothetical protein
LAGRLVSLAAAMTPGSATVYLVWPRDKGAIRRISALRDLLEAALFGRDSAGVPLGPTRDLGTILGWLRDFGFRFLKADAIDLSAKATPTARPTRR